MSDEPEICPDCGAGIPLGGWVDGCPKCLLTGSLDENAATMADTSRNEKSVSPRLVESLSARDGESSSEPASLSGAAAYTPTVEEMRSIFPELEILELLGAGGMGAVYKARQPRLDRLVAVKILGCPPEHRESFTIRFEREAQVLAKLNHPHIVTIFDFGEREWERGEKSELLFYFLMEFVDGADLSRLIRTGDLAPDQALAIVPQICDALQFAHDKGVTHRDIKPANILVDQEGIVRIADFGLAKLLEGEQETIATGLTMTGASMGTPHYMAPEQWESPDKVDHRADIYSLGVVFYEMLTGERPQGIFAPPSKKVAVDGGIDSVVFKAMEKEIDDRYQQASEVKEDVTRVLTSPTERGKRKNASPKVMIPLIASFVALVAFWLVKSEREAEPSKSGLVDVDEIAAEIESENQPTREPFLAGEIDQMQFAEPGRLRAEGVLHFGQPIDLSKAEGIDDFVEVALDTWGWVGLRKGGEVIHGKWGRRPETNVERLLVRQFSWGMIDEAGKLTIVGRSPEEDATGAGISPGVLAIPEDVQRIGVADAAWSDGIAIAHLRDGSARVWGERYEREFAGKEQWSEPPAVALQSVTDVALSQGGCATLGADGRLHLWGPDFAVSEFPQLEGQVVDLESGQSDIRVLLDDGRLFGFFASYGKDGKEIANGVEQIAGYRVLKKGAEKWEYLHRISALNSSLSGALQKVPELPSQQFDVSSHRPKEGGGPKPGVVWIEPMEVGSPPHSIGDESVVSPGRLRSWGIDPNGEPLDLSAADGIGDFVEVLTVRYNDWFALRADGSAISSWGETLPPLAGRKIFGSPLLQPAYTAVDGRLVNNSVSYEIPTLDSQVRDAKLASTHGLILLEDGTVVPVGACSGVGEGAWITPPEEALRNIKAIHLTLGDASVLTREGEVIVWRPDGVVPLPDTLRSGIEATTTAKNGSYLTVYGISESQDLFYWAEEPNKSLPVSGIGKATDLRLLRQAPVFRTNAGEWTLPPALVPSHEEFNEQLPQLADLPTRAWSGHVSGANTEHRSHLIWIESATEPIIEKAVYPTDEAGFRQWLEGKFFQRTESPPNASNAAISWVSGGQLHWLGIPKDGQGPNETKSWSFEVSDPGTLTWEWGGNNGGLYRIRVSPDGKEYDHMAHSPKSGWRGGSRGVVRDDLSRPGRLRALGTMRSGEEFDISEANGFDDFIDVAGANDHWVALRANGETISWRGIADLQNIQSLCWSYSQFFALIDRNGKIHFPSDNRSRELPPSFDAEVFIDVKLGFDHGIALTEDGRALVFGERYQETVPRAPSDVPTSPLPPEEALIDVQAVAATHTHAATLKSDGTLSIFGWEGPLTIPDVKDLGKIKAIESAGHQFRLLDENDQLWRIYVPRKPDPNKAPKMIADVFRLSDPALPITAFRASVWCDANGRWHHETSDLVNELFREATLRPDTRIGAYGGPYQGVQRASLIWIEPLVSEGQPTKFRSELERTGKTAGHIRALGTTSKEENIDLSRVDGFDDFLDVAGRGSSWVGLRKNGETISSNGQANYRNIQRLAWSFSERYALIDQEGRIRFPADQSMELPASFDQETFVDVKLGDNHGIALTDDCRALVFGKRYLEQVGDPTKREWYGTPKWPMPPSEALADVKSIAVTQTHAATLRSDGTLSVFGWQGLLPIPEPEDLARIEAIDSSEDQIQILDANGRLWKLPLRRNPAPGQPVKMVESIHPLSDPSVPVEVLRGEAWLDANGLWHHPDGIETGLLREANLSSETFFRISGGIFNGYRHASLLWIEQD